MGALALLLASALALPGTATAADRLPDLRQEPPSGFALARSSDPGDARWVLGFRSAVTNVGDGPLIIHGHRRSRHVRMTADQEILRADGTTRRVRAVGRMRYVVAPTHQHWHYMHFDRYTLRRVGARHLVRRDVKSGFCLGDRFAVAGMPPATPAYTSNCGPRQPGRMRVTEGISVGFGDDYAANLEGQYVALGGLPAGHYTLTHRANADRRLRETRYDNDVSSSLLDLRWRHGVPRVRLLAVCAGKATCTRPTSARATVAFVGAPALFACRLHVT